MYAAAVVVSSFNNIQSGFIFIESFRAGKGSLQLKGTPFFWSQFSPDRAISSANRIAHGVSSSISSVMTSMITKVGRSEKQVG